jgi:peptidoglycan hydrolase-like protein with peptidoglycan-binding domain
MGATGPAVREIHLALKARGYPLTGTGYFGPQTDTSIEDLQRKAGLPVSGAIDAATADRSIARSPRRRRLQCRSGCRFRRRISG